MYQITVAEEHVNRPWWASGRRGHARLKVTLATVEAGVRTDLGGRPTSRISPLRQNDVSNQHPDRATAISR